jgi:hypothetical protein
LSWLAVTFAFAVTVAATSGRLVRLVSGRPEWLRGALYWVVKARLDVLVVSTNGKGKSGALGRGVRRRLVPQSHSTGLEEV